MEKMLAEADITPANLSKLSAGFQKLGTTVDKYELKLEIL